VGGKDASRFAQPRSSGPSFSADEIAASASEPSLSEGDDIARSYSLWAALERYWLPRDCFLLRSPCQRPPLASAKIQGPESGTSLGHFQNPE
jgi:hypothetical protein